MNWKLWICVPIVYGLFSLWYFNWQGPITQPEVEQFMAQFAEQEGSSHTHKATLRAFLEQDDGKEFIMLNQVQVYEDDIAHPLTGEMIPGRTLLANYFEPFAWALFLRGGHPVFQARTVGGFIDSWNAEDNLSFSGTAMMRYRSRRDIAELVMDPSFADGHIYKLAAIERTVSYPTQIIMNGSMAPHVWVFAVLMLLASLAQNVLLWRQRRKSPSPNA